MCISIIIGAVTAFVVAFLLSEASDSNNSATKRLFSASAFVLIFLGLIYFGIFFNKKSKETITTTESIHPTIAFSDKEVFVRYKSSPPTIVSLDSFEDVTNFQKYPVDSIKFELVTTKNGFGDVIDEKLKIHYPNNN